MINKMKNFNKYICRKEQQQGIALITVLLVFFIASVIASSMLVREHIDVQRTTNILNRTQSYQYALGLEEFAKQIIFEDLEKNRDIDHLKEKWANLRPSFIIEGGTLALEINDLQGLFNVNTLSSNNSSLKKKFNKLLDSLDIDGNVSAELVDWLDDDDETSLNGAEDDIYLLKDPSYRSANRIMSNISEMRLLNSLDNDDYIKMLPYITALPDDANSINVNTASEILLAAFTSKNRDVARILEKREKKGYLTNVEYNVLGIADKSLGVNSSYFEVKSKVEYNDEIFYLVSVLRRDLDAKGNINIDVLSRDFSKKFL